MRLSPASAHWLIWLRWLACAAVLVVVAVSSSLLHIIHFPLPLYLVAAAMVGYNLVFHLGLRHWPGDEAALDRQIFIQIVCDLVALTALLYFSDIARNPFLFYFVFHMVIAAMYLHRGAPYLVAAIATVLAGGVMLLESLAWLPRFPLHFPTEAADQPIDGLARLGVFVAFASTIWMAVYFTLSIHRYIDRAHEEMRQKEKMVGIGQLVSGIAHQIANPLDGLQNCLNIIAGRVKDDPELAEYVEMMGEALTRIERTAKRVQSFARPRGIEPQKTDVNEAVEATLQLLGGSHRSVRRHRFEVARFLSRGATTGDSLGRKSKGREHFRHPQPRSGDTVERGQRLPPLRG
jgi:two-component system sensor histidine kinase RegB